MVLPRQDDLGSDLGKPTRLSPKWVEVSPIRKTQYRGVIDALESRMPDHHQYRNTSDIDNWAHETSHGLHSVLRNTYLPRGNALFIPDRWCCLVENPSGVRLSSIASEVPRDWRGMSYDLYLRKMTQYWDDTPTYVFDEWVSYTNGLHASREYEKDMQSSSAQQMVEFMGYSWILSSLAQDDQLSLFVLWCSLRTIYMLDYCEGLIDLSKARQHLGLLRKSNEGRNFREHVSNRADDAWRREVLG